MNVDETAATATPNPFDPASLALSQDFAATGAVKKKLSRIQVRKPKKQEFVRVRPGADWRLTTMLLEDETAREWYVVHPSLHAELADEATPAHLFTAITKQNDVFLWVVKAPKADGSSNPWNDSAFAATADAENDWVKVVSNMAMGQYDVYQAVAKFADPEWPPETFAELLQLAFGNRFINDINHDVLRKLRGEI
ncbi:MAG: hypothetical protein AAGJ46_06655 [Planctomycetota bacterium]